MEGPGGPGDHRSGQLGDDPLPADELEGRDHGDRHDGDGHEQGEDEALPEVGGALQVGGADPRGGCRGFDDGGRVRGEIGRAHV